MQACLAGEQTCDQLQLSRAQYMVIYCWLMSMVIYDRRLQGQYLLGKILGKIFQSGLAFQRNGRATKLLKDAGLRPKQYKLTC